MRQAATERLLAALQLGDSFFPSGAASHSWGLEGLLRDGELGRLARGPEATAALADFLASQLEGRWAVSDRVATLAAHAAAPELDAIARIDRFVEASTPVAAWRLAGQRCGRALLDTHAALGTPGADAYAARVARGEAPGHAAVVQGSLAAACGLGADDAAAVAGYNMAAGIASAAIRLGLIGHREAQRLLADARRRIAALVATPAPPLEEMSAWVPAAEVAAMRHEARRGRLFAS